MSFKTILSAEFRRVAQLVRALARQARGPQFDSVHAYQGVLSSISTPKREDSAMAGEEFNLSRLPKRIVKTGVLLKQAAW